MAYLAHSTIRLLALAEKLEGPQCLVSADDRAFAAAALRLAAKPADEGVRIPYDDEAKLGYVWLIWGVTKERVDLIAIATTEEACGRYLEAGKQMRRYIAVKEEQAFVDHLYGGGLLKAITNARLPVSTTGEPKRWAESMKGSWTDERTTRRP